MEYRELVRASSFKQLNELMSATPGGFKKGDNIRFTMTLNGPYAPLFNLAGAELLFRNSMPPGIILDDVYGDGWNTVIVDAHATSPTFAAVGAILFAKWYTMPLILIGIAFILGAIITSIGISVGVAEVAGGAPETIPETVKWLTFGAIGVAVIGLTYVYSKKKGYL